MELHPEKQKYKRRVSTAIVSILAGIALVVGILSIIIYFVEHEKVRGTTSLTIGLYCTIISIPLFIISNIADDIHYQCYLQECAMEEDEWYHTNSQRMLRNIEIMLQENFYSQPVPYTSGSFMPMPEPVQPQEAPQPIPSEPNDNTQQYAPYPETKTSRRQYEAQEDTEAEYKAQFMRPTVQTRKAFSPKKEV